MLSKMDCHEVLQIMRFPENFHALAQAGSAGFLVVEGRGGN